MAITFGPKVGLAVNGVQGEEHYSELMAMWRALDALIQPSVIDHTLNSPPGSPADGDCYIVGDSPSGEWSGHANKIARYSSVLSEWEFYTPLPGWIAFSNVAGDHLKFVDDEWVSLSTPASPPPPPPGLGFDTAAGSATLETNIVTGDRVVSNAIFSSSGQGRGHARGAGKLYFEFYNLIGTAATRDLVLGFIEQSYFDSYNQPADSYTSHTAPGAQANFSNEMRSQNSVVAAIGTINSSSILMFAVDFSAGVFYFGIDGTWTIGNPTAGTGGQSFGHTPGNSYRPIAALYDESLRAVIAAEDITVNYGVPTGFVPWNS